MEFVTYVRKPFKVEAVQITKENIDEIAEEIGKIRYKRENGEPFIRVNPRVIPNIQFVYLGFYMTKMGDNIRCYSGRIFEDQFIQTSDAIENWIVFLNQPANSDEVDEAPEVNDADEVNEAVALEMPIETVTEETSVS